MKTILVPTDLSLNARQALDYAVTIAKRLNARIMLLHAYRIDPMYSLMAFPAQLIEEEIASAQNRARTRLEALCRSVTEEHHLECAYLTALARPGVFIQSQLKKIRPALVVMGTHGTDTLGDRLFGSTTAHVIGSARCPVLAIPAKAKFHPIAHMAFAADLDDDHAVLLRQLSTLHEFFPARITVNWVVYDVLQTETCRKTCKKFLHKATKKLGNAMIKCRLITGESAPDATLKLVRNRHYDLLAMVTRHRSFLQELVDPSLTRQIAGRLKIPLLALPVARLAR